MSRDEIVLLVSRVLAVMQAVSALIYVASVPEYLFSANHYASEGYLGSIHRIEVATLLIRIVGLSLLSWLFWRRGPWVAGLLLPVLEGAPATTE